MNLLYQPEWGKRRRKQRDQMLASKLPLVTPHTQCRLKLLKLERIKDYLLMEEKFIRNQEQMKPLEEKQEEERSKVDDLRGTPMSVGTLEEIVDDNHAIMSTMSASFHLWKRICWNQAAQFCSTTKCMP
ncbi:Hypothetical predicted protein [Marmota monax]|uniref:Uncharacterized protein n=1 Tax=Marmota monax TaxID=9995 RepID=A0A5E4BF72_MARMO|nr:Hypothetical predicted protein [Marmota monax]